MSSYSSGLCHICYAEPNHKLEEEATRKSCEHSEWSKAGLTASTCCCSFVATTTSTCNSSNCRMKFCWCHIVSVPAYRRSIFCHTLQGEAGSAICDLRHHCTDKRVVHGIRSNNSFIESPKISCFQNNTWWPLCCHRPNVQLTALLAQRLRWRDLRDRDEQIRQRRNWFQTRQKLGIRTLPHCKMFMRSACYNQAVSKRGLGAEVGQKKTLPLHRRPYCRPILTCRTQMFMAIATIKKELEQKIAANESLL